MSENIWDPEEDEEESLEIEEIELEELGSKLLP